MAVGARYTNMLLYISEHGSKKHQRCRQDTNCKGTWQEKSDSSATFLRTKCEKLGSKCDEVGSKCALRLSAMRTVSTRNSFRMRSSPCKPRRIADLGGFVGRKCEIRSSSREVVSDGSAETVAANSPADSSPDYAESVHPERKSIESIQMRITQNECFQ